MLNSSHFISTTDPKTWNELVEDKVVIQCKKCKKWIWTRWHSEKEWIDQCALCYKDD